MLTCHACMKHCLQTLIGDSALLSTSGRTTLATNHIRRTYRRNISTSAPRVYAATNASEKRANASSERQLEKNGISTSFNRQQWLESRGVTPLHKRKEMTREDQMIKKHLQYLKDPLKLADHVRKSLREDDFEQVLDLVRVASKDVQCTVSWNHLIDWQLSKGKMNAAIKTYNEMKKRAQTPDAHTFTIIFRGCAENDNAVAALAKVISIYHSMLTDKSPMKPNTIHMNAVLKMCARAKDMDALFSIAASMPPKGVRAPNNLTYTIILNALRNDTLGRLGGDLTTSQQQRIRQKANLDARKLWDDVTRRWMQGDILIDEELVCTMGRVLLLGEEQDIDDILSVVDQTMNIRRPIPPLGSLARQKIDPKGQNKVEPPQNQGQLEAPQIQNTNTAPAEKEPGPASEGCATEELGVTPGDRPPVKMKAPIKSLTKSSTRFYAKPGNNTLSLLMQALLDMRFKAPATAYWNLFTQELSVQPDAANYHSYLRILRFARASTETVQLLLTMPQSYLETKTFRIAMSTCDRDKRNPHSFSNAGKILDLMQNTIEVPDVQALSTYLDVAITSNATNTKQPSLYAQGKQIFRALERISPSFLNLKSLLAYGDSTQRPQSLHQKEELTQSLLLLTRKMISAYDILMNKAMVDRSLYQDLTRQKSQLTAFVTRHKHIKNSERYSRPQAKDSENVEVTEATEDVQEIEKSAEKATERFAEEERKAVEAIFSFPIRHVSS